MAGGTGTLQPLAATPPFNLWATALSHGWHALAPFRWHDATDTLERVDRLPSGKTYVLKVRAGSDRSDGWPQVDLRVSPTPSKPDALELRSRVRHMLRLDEDLADFYARCRTSRALRPIAQLGAGRLLRSPDLWEDIVKGICTTNVTWSRTRTMVASITALTAAATSTAAYGAFPTPDEILTAGVQYLTTEAGVGYRARSILNLAEGVKSGTIDLMAMGDPELPTTERLAALETLPGIGPITARYLAMLLGSYDDLALDSATRSFAIRTFGPNHANAKSVSRHYTRFGRWRALAFWCQHWLAWPSIHKRTTIALTP